MLKLKDLKELTKAVLSGYNASVTTLMYYHGCASPDLVSGATLFAGSCTYYAVLLACSTQAMNQVIEADKDALMQRTRLRPVVTNKISAGAGAALSLALGSSAVYTLSGFGLETALLGSGIWAGYIGVYIPLKRYTRFNTHVGSVIGALPVYLGWMAAQGSWWALDPFLMFVFMVAWQFPHFYGIAWTYKRDFEKAGFKVIPQSDWNGE